MAPHTNTEPTTIEIQNFKKSVPYFTARLISTDTDEQLNAARCKINFNYNEVTVTDKHGNTDIVFVTYRMERDLHELLKGWAAAC